MINVEGIQRTVAEALFVKAQRMAVERFEFACGSEGSTPGKEATGSRRDDHY